MLMRRYLTLLAVWVCVAPLAHGQQEPPKPLTPQQQEQLKEREQLFQQANKLFQDGKRAEALATVEKGLAIEREVFGYVQSVAWLGWLASQYEQAEDFTAAR